MYNTNLSPNDKFKLQECILLNPIPRGLWYNLFQAGGGGIYAPPLWFLGKKSFLPNSFCTLKQLPK